jgi:hypothetical protein
MRQALPTLIILLVCTVVLAGYFFGGKPQVDKQEQALRAENDRLYQEVESLNRMKLEIPELIKQLPEWKQQIELFRTAIPNAIDDQVFLAKLAEQMKQRNVELISVELAPGGPWLGNVSDEERERLTGIGVDVNAAMAVKIADYTIKLNGEFGDIVQAFESLKGYRRLYTLNEFAGPAVGAGGAIAANLNQEHTPMMVAGSLYYGLPEGGLTEAELDEVIAQILISPFSQRVQREVSRRGGDLLSTEGRNGDGNGGGKPADSASRSEPGSTNPAASTT